MKDRDDDNALTPERMQEQCALVVDKLESLMDGAAHKAATAAKTSIWKFWAWRKKKSAMEFYHAAIFASTALHGAAMVIRGMPNDHPVEVSVQEKDASDAMDMKISTKPKGVTLQ